MSEQDVLARLGDVEAGLAGIQEQLRRMRTQEYGSLFEQTGVFTGDILLSFDPQVMGGRNDTLSGAAPTSATYRAANRAFFYPFYLTEPKVARYLFVVNGTAVSGNIDLGIYRASDSGTAQKIITTGSTAQSGTSAAQVVSISATQLAVGQYYMAIAIDNTTATTYRTAMSTIFFHITGARYADTAFALPATVTFATAVVPTDVHLMGISFRSTFP